MTGESPNPGVHQILRHWDVRHFLHSVSANVGPFLLLLVVILRLQLWLVVPIPVHGDDEPFTPTGHGTALSIRVPVAITVAVPFLVYVLFSLFCYVHKEWTIKHFQHGQ